ncbi:GPP34 family phosphoprotein [Actinoplanes sp. NPDC051633]|uniref:GPP34 family phosphoprotein n=1 Tax=Actinoplanes sp. NPDC051633 TaxID=3155670 RepID=UPI003427D7BD
MAVTPQHWDQPKLSSDPRPDPNVQAERRALRSGPRHAAWTGRNTQSLSGPFRANTPSRSGRKTWPLVADDLFLVAGDEWGKLRLHRDVARIGLAAALLAELILAEYATVELDSLVPACPEEPIDRLAGAVIRQVRAERSKLPVRTWIDFLATVKLADDDVFDHVGHRLERAGRVDAQERGIWWWHRVVYVPHDLNDCAWAGARISTALRRGEAFTLSDVAFAGLMLATGLHRYALLGHGSEIEQQLRVRLAQAPAGLRALIRHTEDAVSTAIKISN